MNIKLRVVGLFLLALMIVVPASFALAQDDPEAIGIPVDDYIVIPATDTSPAYALLYPGMPIYADLENFEVIAYVGLDNIEHWLAIDPSAAELPVSVDSEGFRYTSVVIPFETGNQTGWLSVRALVPANEVVVEIQTYREVTTLSNVNIREVATTESDVLKTVPTNQAIEIVEDIPDGQAVNGNSLWYIVDVDGIRGYIWSGAVGIPVEQEIEIYSPGSYTPSEITYGFFEIEATPEMGLNASDISQFSTGNQSDEDDEQNDAPQPTMTETPNNPQPVFTETPEPGQ